MQAIPPRLRPIGCFLAALAAALLPAALRDHGATCLAGETKSSPVAAALQPYVDRQTLAGAVTLIADKDKTLDVAAVGFADIAGKRPMLADLLFWIASQSKPITAAALMMLVDEGKLKLDDPVEKYLPEFRGQWLAVESDKDHVLLMHPARPATVRDVLRHTSGMPFRSAMEQPTMDMLPLKVTVASYAMTPLVYEPGTKYQYSNAGINTAGRLIEVLSGMSYEDFLQKRLFDPLGMKDTTFVPTEAQVKRLAKSYKPGPDKKGLEEIVVNQLHYPLSDGKRQPVPAGGAFSTADDLSRFCRMLLNDGVFEGKRLLSSAAVKELSTRQTPAGLKESYGLGFSVGDGSFGHGGAYATNMNIDTKRGLITIFMVQHNGFPGDGGQSLQAFRRAAEDHFGKKK